MKKLICTVISAALLLSGCSGGSLYTNYREVEQLTVIQTMGFDRSSDGITLSVSTGNSGGGTSANSSVTRMSATEETVSLAQDKMRDHSASEELFFAHTSYIVLGEDAAKQGITPFLDYVSRSVSLREGTPIFIIVGDSAKALVLGAGGDDYDATNVLRSLERNIKHRGDLHVFTAANVTADLNRRGACLIAAIKCVDAKDVIEGAGDDELTAVPAGYAVIKDGKMVGTLGLDAARGVAILRNELRSCYVELDDAAVVTDNCECKIDEDAREISVRLSSALAEGNEEPEALGAALKSSAEKWIRSALAAVDICACDFLGIDAPDYSTYNINVYAEVGRSFDIDKSEDAQ